MSPDPQNTTNVSVLGNFAGFIGVLSIFIYFVGWIYRWAYFGFFQIELNTLSFSPDSFLIVPIQVTLGDTWIFIRSILALITTILLIQITLWVIRPMRVSTAAHSRRRYFSKFMETLHKFTKILHHLFLPLRRISEFLPPSLRKEMVIVAWILAALFWLGRYQGTADAFRDAVNDTSTRPVVSLVSPTDKLPLGRDLDDIFTNPSLKGSRIIGDVDQFRNIFGKETNDTSNPKEPIVWRLLVENNNWVYVFPAMPPSSTKNQRPPVLTVNTGDGGVQLLILSPPDREIK